MSKIIPLDTKTTTNNKSKTYRYLIIAFIIIIILLAFLLQFFKVEKVTISGNDYYTNDEILQMLDMDSKTNIILFKLFGSKKTFDTYPYIESIHIESTNQNEISIKVVEKRVIGYLPYMGKYIGIDKEGNVIDYVASTAEGIPLIKGLYFQNFIIGDKLNIADELVFNAIFNIYNSMKKYSLPIETINFHLNTVNDIDLSLGQITIHIGNMDNIVEKFSMLSEILTTIDMREKGNIDLSDINKKIIFEKE